MYVVSVSVCVRVYVCVCDVLPCVGMHNLGSYPSSKHHGMAQRTGKN